MEESNLHKVKDLLELMEISEQITNESLEEYILLSSLVKELIDFKNRCRESIIYRIAMTLYHSSRYWDSHIIDILDDPISVYFKLSSNTIFQEKYPDLWETINLKRNRMLRTNFMKTLICFLMATFLYYNNGGE